MTNYNEKCSNEERKKMVHPSSSHDLCSCEGGCQCNCECEKETLCDDDESCKTTEDSSCCRSQEQITPDLNSSSSCCRSSSKKEEKSMASVEKESQEWKDKYMRALAEVENVRKRLTREKIEGQGFAIQNVIADFLQPFDQLELALKHADNAAPDVKMWATGFQMILEQFKQLLTSYDVQIIPGVGAQFDPNLHEAIEVEERNDVSKDTIIEVFQKGYKIGSRTLRPARVKVATDPKCD